MPPRPRRRTVMSAAIAVPASLLATTTTGCTLSGSAPEPPSGSPKPAVDPDVALLDLVTDSTEAMVALYKGTIDRHRDLAHALRPLLAAHRRHATALGDAAPGSASKPPRDRKHAPRADVPRRPAAALRTLRSAERTSTEELLGYTRRADSGSFARLLASMSACSAQHRQVLTGVDTG